MGDGSGTEGEHDLQPDLMQSSVAVSVLIVDDTCLHREGLADLLRDGGWAGEVQTAADASAAIRSLQFSLPDIVLVNMASCGALATLAVLRGAAPAARVIALAVSETDEIVACAEAGVVGFLPRHGTLRDLELTVAGVVRGEAVCSPRVAGVLLRRVTMLAAQSTEPTDTGHLTPREREVLVLVEQGMTNKQIALHLGIEVRTVKNHVHNLLEKLQVRRRGEAAARLRSARVPAFQLLHGASTRTGPSDGRYQARYQAPVSPNRGSKD